MLDQKEAKIKAERCFCPRAFTLARRSAGPGFFIFLDLRVVPPLLQTGVALFRMTFTRLRTGVARLRTGVALFRMDVALFRTGVALLRMVLALLRMDVALLRTTIACLRMTLARLRTDVAYHRLYTALWFTGSHNSILLPSGSMMCTNFP